MKFGGADAADNPLTINDASVVWGSLWRKFLCFPVNIF